PESPPPCAPGGDSSETILVVEDDDDVRSYSTESLRELGFTVLEAHDGATALKVLDRCPQVQLLFTDVGLPGVNGRQLADEAQRREGGAGGARWGSGRVAVRLRRGRVAVCVRRCAGRARAQSHERPSGGGWSRPASAVRAPSTPTASYSPARACRLTSISANS